MIIYRHESFPFAVANLVKGYEEWYGSTALRLPEEIFGPDRYWMKRIMRDLKPEQKRPFILAVDDGRRSGLTEGELRQSKCSFVIFHSGWFDKDQYEWAWRVLKVWPDILEKCNAAFEINKQCKLSVTTNGKIFVGNL